MPRPTSLVPPSATIGKNGRKVCGAKKKTGPGRCQNTAVSPVNGRCRKHGMNSPRGMASPNLKTGRYSQDLPTRVAARYESALTDPTLLSVRDDIALLQGAITDIMAEIRDAEARPDYDKILGTIERIESEHRTWDYTRMDRELAALRELAGGRVSQARAMREIRELIKEKSTLVAQENKLLADRQQFISIEQYLMGMKALGAAVRRVVDDTQQLRAIDVEFRRLATVTERKD